MDVLNVVVTDSTDGTVISMESFAIIDEQLRGDIVDKAELCLIRKLPIDIREDDEQIDIILEDGGVVLDEEKVAISLGWTTIDV